MGEQKITVTPDEIQKQESPAASVSPGGLSTGTPDSVAPNHAELPRPTFQGSAEDVKKMPWPAVWASIGRRKHVFIPISLIAGIGCLFLVCQKTAPVVPESSDRVVFGHDYWVAVTTLEAFPANSEGETWDNKGPNEAPDLYYTITWQNNEIYRSTTQQDSLIANFSMINLNVLDAVFGGKLSLDSVTKAALIHASPDTTFEVRVFDSDVWSDHLVGSRSFTIGDMRIGDNSITSPEEHTGIKRMVIRIVDKATPLKELVEVLSKP